MKQRVFQEAYPARARTYRSAEEAFKDVEYASPIRHYRQPLSERMLFWFQIVGGVACLAWVLFLAVGS